MYKASKINHTTASSRSTRRNCVWIPADLCGLTHAQWWDERLRDDYCFSAIKSNKKCAHCKRHSRFPDCSARIRQYKLPDGEIVSETTGVHDHDLSNEVHKHGLPQRYKEAIDEFLLLNNKFKPSIIVKCLEKKFNNNLSKEQNVQVGGYVNRNRSKHRERYEANTVEGVKSFVKNHPYNDSLGDHDVYVADSVIESNRFHVHFTSRSMIGQFVGKDYLVFANDETFRMVYNNFTLRVMGVIDKQMRFTPTGFSLDSHADEKSSEWALKVTSFEIERLYGVKVTPWRSMNDNSDAIFNSMLTVWPGTRQGQCYFHVFKQVKKSYGKYLRNKSKLDPMITDLKKIQEHPFPDMTSKLYELLKTKYKEPEFLSNLIHPIGMVCSNVG